ncbi:unnamed protein product [Clavelina lepadiformis]|uniref:Protein kinase domain-containing protein n=1 Tax=Clavelina lepadiformis TaxID=159417 RepID=A0ABP0G8C4_CLALP
MSHSKLLPSYEASDFLTSWNDLDLLGSGAFAAVRKCYHKKFGPIAVKCFGIPGPLDDLQEFIEKNSREAKVLSRIQHKNIVQVHGMLQWSNFLGIVIDFMDGGNLKDLLQERKIPNGLPWRLRLRIILEIVDALSYLHFYKSRKAIIHGDLKPENILLSLDLRVKLGDFGSAHFAAAVGASQMTVDIPKNRQHSVLYTAPEFLDNANLPRHPSMDIYSLAIVIYEVMTCVSAYDGAAIPLGTLIHLIIATDQRPNERVLTATKSELRSKGNRDDCSILDILEDVMKRCWKKQPVERPAIDTVQQDLNKIFQTIDARSIVMDVANVLQSFPPTPVRDQSVPSVPLSQFTFPFQSSFRPPQDNEICLEMAETEPKFIVMIGGWKTRDMVRKYCPETNTFFNLPNLTIGRWHLCAASVNNRVLAIGGKTEGDVPTDSMECLNLDDDEPAWVMKSPMHDKRYHAASAVLRGLVYVCGGWDDMKICLSSMEFYNYITDQWTKAGSMKVCREGHSVVSTHGKLYILGGYDGTKRLTSLECHDITNNEVAYVRPLHEQSSHHASAYLNGKIYTMGGLDGDLTFLRRVLCYHCASDKWLYDVTSMKENRVSLSSCCIDGKLYAAGGRSYGRSMTTIERYAEAINKWEIVAEMNDEWYRFAMVTV